MIKIILAEDHNIVRSGIKMLLDTQQGISVVAETANGQQVLDLIADGLEVDLILSDLIMPVLDGIGLIQKLKRMQAAPKVIILTMLDSEKHVMKAFEAGTQGYLLKNLEEDELIFAIKTVYEGVRYVSSELALLMLDEHLKKAKVEETRKDYEFSNREREVLDLVVEGYTDKDIGEKLFLSKRTIEGHRQSLLVKTGSKNTAMLIKFACLNNYFS